MASRFGITTVLTIGGLTFCAPCLRRLWGAAALQHGHRTSGAILSSIALRAEHFLNDAGADRWPWLAVGVGGGIGLWFALANAWLWLGVSAFGIGLAALALLFPAVSYGLLRGALAGMGLAVAAGCALIWAKSALVGTPAIVQPMAPVITARVMDRYAQPADHRLRLELAFAEPGSGRPILARLSMPEGADRPGLTEGAIVRLRARLMPPGAPDLPGGYDAARAAWFDGVAATGTVIGPVTVLTPAAGDSWLARARHALADHVRSRVAGPAGGIAAAFASGDRGGIPASDEAAMRDSGLTHLLSVSGLHVSAVIAGVYVLAIRLLALFPWLALRVRLPLLASACGGLAGIGYTLLTGAQVPTVRSVLGALLVMLGLALGRQPFTVRLLAVAAICTMLLWPEAVIGPSFQMSFGSVLALVVLHDCAPVRAFLAPREEGWWVRMTRHLAMILLAGMVIDLALMPIALFHFHRAGIYGSMANLVAIPLTTFVSMPAIALGLALDLVGAGGPAWWVCGQSLDLLLAIARWTAARPASVTIMPAMDGGRFVLFVGGMLWLALWHGRARLWGLVPAVAAILSLAWLHPPSVLITGDGRNIGITGVPGRALLILREGKGARTGETMLEAAGLSGPVTPLATWPGARCSEGFCALDLDHGGRRWRLLIARGKGEPAPAQLAGACAQSDIVVAPDKLYGPCHPRIIKADRSLLLRSGGLALDLEHRTVTTVAQSAGDHPWWRAPHLAPRQTDEP
jgi:competence protein ComEC